MCRVWDRHNPDRHRAEWERTRVRQTLNNFKFLIDVFPFRNKHWHVTAGFYWGKSQFGYAENSTSAMTSLLAVGMFNQIYDRAANEDEPLFYVGDTPVWDAYELRQRVLNYGGRILMRRINGNYQLVDICQNIEKQSDDLGFVNRWEQMILLKCR